MKCPICGQDIADNSKFCAKCGAKIPRCPTCGKVITKRIRFCTNDGTPIPEDVLALITAHVPTVVQVDNQPDAARNTSSPERTNPERQISDTQETDASDSPAQSSEVQRGREPVVPPPLDDQKPSASHHPPVPPSESSQKRHFCIRCGNPCAERELLCEHCKQETNRKPDMNLYSEAEPPDKKKKGKAHIVVIVFIIILLLAGGATCAYALFHWGGVVALAQTQDSSTAAEITVQDRTDGDVTASSVSDTDTELAVGSNLSPER